jgi:hypothetical protein
VIYATARRIEAPEVRFPADADETAEPKRGRASKLEAEPLLRSLPLFRYS